MTNKEILQIAYEQSAIDLNCHARDFEKEENVIVYSKEQEGCRRYLKLPFFCNLVSYGSNIVASVAPEAEAVVREYINKYPVEHCFETPNMHVLSEGFLPFDMKVCFMAEYFLPDVNQISKKECGYELRLLTSDDFAELYVPQWGNALCADRKHLDVLGVGAYDKGKLVGLAGCSADCDKMWQIGVDVLPKYRRQGIAAAVTSNLAYEILKRDKVPFYCAAWSNIKSVRNALQSGFKPAWAELTAKPAEFVKSMIQ